MGHWATFVKKSCGFPVPCAHIMDVGQIYKYILPFKVVNLFNQTYFKTIIL